MCMKRIETERLAHIFFFGGVDGGGLRTTDVSKTA